MKEKKNLQFGVRIDDHMAKTIKNLSRRANLSMGEIVRLCVNRQLEDTGYLLELARDKRNWQLGVKFEEHTVRALKKVSGQIGLPMAEIIRLCLTKQLEQICNEGSIKINLTPDGK
jgi:antitoxin component of RelBE/YafQ-DinJ toxin-antitoxin module